VLAHLPSPIIIFHADGSIRTRTVFYEGVCQSDERREAHHKMNNIFSTI